MLESFARGWARRGAGLQGRLGLASGRLWSRADRADRAAQHAGRGLGKAHGLIALSYLLGGLCMAFTATSYAVMVREVRSAGSLYGFARAALGPFAGFMGGWMILLDYLMIPSLVYVIMAVALGQLMPEVDRAVWIVALLGFTTAVNWFGIRSTSAFNAVSVIAQIAVMVGRGRRRAVPGADPCLFARAGLGRSAALARRAGGHFGLRAELPASTRSPRWPRHRRPQRAHAGAGHSGRAGAPARVLRAVHQVLGNAMVGRHFAKRDAAHYELAGAMLGAWARPGLAWFTALVVGLPMPCRCRCARVRPAGATDRCRPCLPGCIRATTHRGWRCLHHRRCRWWSRWCFCDALDFWRPWSTARRPMGLPCCTSACCALWRSDRRNPWLHVSPLVGLAVIAVILSGRGAWALRWLPRLGLACGRWLARHARPASDLGPTGPQNMAMSAAVTPATFSR
jgi:hypothetical protein